MHRDSLDHPSVKLPAIRHIMTREDEETILRITDDTNALRCLQCLIVSTLRGDSAARSTSGDARRRGSLRRRRRGLDGSRDRPLRGRVQLLLTADLGAH